MTATLCTLLADGTLWLEPAASTSATRHDAVFHTLLYVTGFFFFLVIALMLTFVVLYRRRNGEAPVKKGDRHLTSDGSGEISAGQFGASPPFSDVPTHGTALEIVWTAIPIGVVTMFFVIGFRGFLDAEIPPTNAEVIDVEMRQWAYTFTYPNGAVSERLYLRRNRPVTLQLRSADVLHSLYIPAFRLQRNAVPGRTVQMWFQPTEFGSYHIFCTQYCGNGHSLMTTQAEVLDAAAYDAKLAALANIFVDPATQEPLPYAQVGAMLYKTSGCAQCHSIDGAPNTGPTWQGLFKRDHTFAVAPSGYTLLAKDDDAKWDAYLHESVLDPGAKVVEGYQNVMPPYAAQFSGTPYKEKKLAAIVAYIKRLGNQGAPKDDRSPPHAEKQERPEKEKNKDLGK